MKPRCGGRRWRAHGRRSGAADAAARGIEVEIITRPAARSLEEAAELLGITPADIVKSLVVKRSDDTFLFALVPGGRKISWPKLRALRRREQAAAAGCRARARGDRLRARHDHAARLDDRLAGRTSTRRIVGRRVSMGAGEHGRSLFVDADDLIAALDATVADISDPE